MQTEQRLEIWSGGQTGVDRAALDVALELAIPYRGWVPRGRMAEDGRLAERYLGLEETASARPDVRTRRNVRDTDATLIIAFGEVSGGTALARDTALRIGRPLLIVDLRVLEADAAADQVERWLQSLHRPVRLNVAGPRASHAGDAYAKAAMLLRAVLG